MTNASVSQAPRSKILILIALALLIGIAAVIATKSGPPPLSGAAGLLAPDKKSCKTDADCMLRSCSGCLNAAYLRAVNPPEPPCMQYNPTFTTCACVQATCQAKAKPDSASPGK